MRLLYFDSQDKIRLTSDLSDEECPRYAILSHCWAKDNSEEVTFAEIETDAGRQKPGCKKIQFCAEQARRDDIKYFWVDTCCIDKTNHVELSKAITSMFRWYQQAEKCYVYLSDVSSWESSHDDTTGKRPWESDFRQSRWFRRGWTLQELLAPRVVQFFSRDREMLGDRTTLATQIHEVTTIPLSALSGTDLARFSIDERIRWTTKRKTKEAEDRAYCLLGLFDVYLPLIYGEKENAWRRLRREIQDRYGKDINIQPDRQIGPLGFCLGSAPRINPSDFVGRTAEITNIHDILRPTEVNVTQRMAVLGGFGGVGKTQLALAYARHYQQYYPSVLWLNAASEATLKASFRTILQSLVKAHQLAQLSDDQVVARAHEWLSDRDNNRWLLIFDNYDEPDQFRVEAYIPNIGHGEIIVTTRLPELVTGEKIRVQSLRNIDDSLAILANRSQRPHTQKDSGARRLAKRLDGLPLALVTAGAFLRTSTLSFEQYLDAYEQKWNINPQRPPRLLDYQDRTLYTTWNLSYDRLREEEAGAAKMLHLLAYLDNQDVWYDLLAAGLTNDSPEWLREALGELTSFESTMAVLIEYGLVELRVDNKSYSIHNCVHDWTLGELNRAIIPDLYWFVFDCVASSVDRDAWKTLGNIKYGRVSQHARRLAHSWFGRCVELNVGIAGREDQTHHVARMLQEQMHLVAAEQMYGRALAGYETALGPDHTSTLDTVNNLGLLYRDQGKLDKAEQMYQRALAGKETALGPDHTSTLDTVNNLGILYRDQGKLDKAEQMYGRALAGYETALGPDHTSTLSTVNNLGLLYSDQGKLDKAEQMYGRALAGYETALGPDHISTLSTVNNLGNLYSHHGKLDKAEQMYGRALAGCETALGPYHTSTLSTVNNLGGLYRDQGKLDKAEQMYQRALAGCETALGPDHTSTLNTVNDLGVLYADQGKLDKAEQMYERALAGYEIALGPDHTSTLNTVNNLGGLYRDQGKLDKAEQMYGRALAGYEIALGPDHTSTLNTVNNLGGLYRNQGKLDKAEQMSQRALAGRETALGPDHTSTLSTVNNLGALYADQGKLDKAEQMYERALAGKETALGPNHTSTLNTVNNLGALYADQGKLDKAEQMYQRALAGYETALGPDHTSTLDTVNNLGNLYADQGKLDKAEQMYQRALAGYETALGTDHTSTLDTVNNLGNLYADQGKLDKAEQMYERALIGYEKQLGEGHPRTRTIAGSLDQCRHRQGARDVNSSSLAADKKRKRWKA